MENCHTINGLLKVFTETDEDLKKAFRNMNDLMIKLRLIGQLLNESEDSAKDICDKEFALNADLNSMKQLLKNFNTQCGLRLDGIDSTKSLIDDNKWLRYPQYPLPDLKPYIPGCEIEGCISHIKNPAKGTFFIMDIERKSGFSTLFRLFQSKEDLTRITDLDKIETGDLIAVVVDDTITRALVEMTNSGILLLLIDLGEEISYETDLELYKMADYYKHLPSQAILCKVKPPSKNLALNLYQDVKVEVLRIEFNTLLVKFLQPEELVEAITETEDETASSIVSSNTQYSTTNPFLSDLADEKAISEFMNDEITTTSNAMVAVLGYDPKDEAQYCKHYDEKTGGCFKGVNCTFLHQKPLDDGWTRDQVEAWKDIPEKIMWPLVHAQLTIELSVVSDIHKFFGYITDPEYHRSTAISLNELNHEINALDKIKKYKKFSKILPCIHELVLAPYQGELYRARVISVDDDSVEVFFLDYGNFHEAYIKDLFCWEPQFGKIPFQAMDFQIAGILPNKASKLSMRMDELFKHINRKKAIAVVVDNSTNILVRLFINNIEVKDLLKASGLAIKYDNLHPQKPMSIIPV